MAYVPEAVRSKAWAAAKSVALEEWSKGSSDTTQMLIACSRGLDAALAEIWPDESDGDKARRRLREEFGYPNRVVDLTDEEAVTILAEEQAARAVQ